MADDLAELRARIAALAREVAAIERAIAAEPWWARFFPRTSGAHRNTLRMRRAARDLAALEAEARSRAVAGDVRAGQRQP
jgi:hypothetical protein